MDEVLAGAQPAGSFCLPSCSLTIASAAASYTRDIPLCLAHPQCKRSPCASLHNVPMERQETTSAGQAEPREPPCLHALVHSKHASPSCRVSTVPSGLQPVHRVGRTVCRMSSSSGDSLGWPLSGRASPRSSFLLAVRIQHAQRTSRQRLPASATARSHGASFFFFLCLSPRSEQQ
jgi:hypothetical protein